MRACAHCGTELTQRANECNRDFNQRTHCNNSCAGLHQAQGRTSKPYQLTEGRLEDLTMLLQAGESVDIMAEHYKDPRAWAIGPWCHKCVSAPWPCETYRLAAELAVMREREQRVEALLPEDPMDDTAVDENLRHALWPLRTPLPVGVRCAARTRPYRAALDGDA